MTEEYVPSARDFENESFALMNKLHFDRYIQLRVEGVSTYKAFRQVFGDDLIDGFTTSRIYALERNPYYLRTYKARFDAMKPNEVWTAKTALHELLQIVKDDHNKATARLAAIKELNVLCGITVIDDLGKTKLIRALDDFYKENGGESRIAPTDDASGESQAHPAHPTTH